MISRYDDPVISQLWSLENKYNYFLKVEQALLKNLEKHNRIPQGCADSVGKATINLERIHELDLALKHDVIAFCTSITEQMPPEHRAFFHYGVTSSDIIDTALMLQMKESLDQVGDVLLDVINSLKSQIEKSQGILGLGRSHGIYAEPMVFAQKWLGHLAEFARRHDDFKNYVFSGQFSGAVGNYSILTPAIEADTLSDLGLRVEAVSTQVIPRDRVATLVNHFSLLGCAIERISIEIRHLHHSDINEVCEGFSANQKGSSTMPHKKNPVSTENLSGLARILRSYTQVANDNCLLWHERDISHSSSERLYLPDMFGVAYYSLKRLSNTLDGLTYNEEIIENKVHKNPKVFSSLILHELIENSSLSREQAYEIVQKACFEKTSLEEIQNYVERESGHELGLIKFDLLKTKYQESFKQVYTRVQASHTDLF